MIKVQATINGVISKSATVRAAGDGKKFIGFPVKLTVPGSRNNMPGKELTVSVSKDGDESELTAFAAGTRIEATGMLTFRKTGDNLYFNLHADTINLSPESNKDAIEGMLEPVMKEEIVASVEVLEIFKITKVGTVAGCMVREGKLQRSTPIRVIRDGIVIYTGKLGSLKRFKDDVKEVVVGQDCGLNIESFNDIRVGDIVEGYEQVEVKRK